MRNRDKTAAGLAKLAAESRQAAGQATGEDRAAHERVAAELDQMAAEAGGQGRVATARERYG